MSDKELIIAGWKVARVDDSANIIVNNTDKDDWSGALLTPNEENIEGSLFYRLLNDALKEFES